VLGDVEKNEMKVVAFTGSLRASSYNLSLIHI